MYYLASSKYRDQARHGPLLQAVHYSLVLSLAGGTCTIVLTGGNFLEADRPGLGPDEACIIFPVRS